MKQQQLGKVDVHGTSLRGENHERNHDHYAVAALNKSMRVHQSNLTLDDDSRIHGQNQGHLFVVADGVSGGPAPALASGRAVDTVVQFFLNEMPWHHLADGPPEDVSKALGEALYYAQEELLHARGSVDGMGTTLTMAFVSWPHLHVAHVGDSRCYLHRDGVARLLTKDHTLAEVRREAGAPTEDRHEQVLWNAVGGHDASLHTDVDYHELQLGDSLVLVTDGVLKDLGPKRLETALEVGASAEEVCSRLVRERGPDDRTVVVARFLPAAHSAAALEGGVPAPLQRARQRVMNSIRKLKQAVAS